MSLLSDNVAVASLYLIYFLGDSVQIMFSDGKNIYKSGRSGSGRTTLVSNTEAWAIAIHRNKSKLFWADVENDKVSKCDMLCEK